LSHTPARSTGRHSSSNAGAESRPRHHRPLRTPPDTPSHQPGEQGSCYSSLKPSEIPGHETQRSPRRAAIPGAGNGRNGGRERASGDASGNHQGVASPSDSSADSASQTKRIDRSSQPTGRKTAGDPLCIRAKHRSTPRLTALGLYRWTRERQTCETVVAQRVRPSRRACDRLPLDFRWLPRRVLAPSTLNRAAVAADRADR
jgi:hypothetical protein